MWGAQQSALRRYVKHNCSSFPLDLVTHDSHNNNMKNMVITIALYYFFDNGRGEGGGGLGWTGGSSVEEGVGLSIDFKQVL